MGVFCHINDNDGMLNIDGSHGEGGGQNVRSSLSLSLVTGRSIKIENIRAGRKKSGLLRQHLTAVKAAAEISGANVQGDQLHSSKLVFEPGPARCGSYTFRIGTAGSTTLVLQTILPATEYLKQVADFLRKHLQPSDDSDG